MTTLKAYEPGDVKLISIKLTNGNKSAIADIKTQTIAISIYEDIEQPTVYAELAISDGLNLVKDFPIIGEEDLEVSFVTPGRDNITTYKLRVFSITNTNTQENAMTSTYMIKCVSHEHFTNTVQQVDKAYSGTVSEMVLAVLQDELKVTKDIKLI